MISLALAWVAVTGIKAAAGKEDSSVNINGCVFIATGVLDVIMVIGIIVTVGMYF